MNEQLGYPYRTTRYEAIVKRATAQQPAATQRAGRYAGLHPEDTPYITGQLQAQEEELEEDDSYYTPRTVPSSARRYHMVPDGHVIQQGNKRIVVHYGAPPIKHRRHTQEPQPPQAPVRKHIHWLVFVGIGMVLMGVSWIGVNGLGTW